MMVVGWDGVGRGVGRGLGGGVLEHLKIRSAIGVLAVSVIRWRACRRDQVIVPPMELAYSC